MTTPNKHDSKTNNEALASHKLPIGKAEDVEYAEELADAEDRAAQARAQAADERSEQ